MATLASLLADKSPKLVAIGEIGLDLYMDEPQFPHQLVILNMQLELAKQHDLPVILHSRRSHDPLAAALRKAALPRAGVIHGFAGSLAQAQAFIRLGYYIGVGGPSLMNERRKPVMLWPHCRSPRCSWKPMHPICLWRVFKGKPIALNEQPMCLPPCVSCAQSQPMRLRLS